LLHCGQDISLPNSVVESAASEGFAAEADEILTVNKMAAIANVEKSNNLFLTYPLYQPKNTLYTGFKIRSIFDTTISLISCYSYFMGNNKKITKHRWPEGAIVYQIYPRSFYDSNSDGIGDIPGVTKKLDYLNDLGVNAIWLSPFYPSPMADFGYDVADYCDVDPIFGKLSDMDTLIRKSHELSMKIMVDLVPNHTSDDHEWFRQSRQSKEDPYSDWYIWQDPKSYKNGRPIPPNNWLNIFTGETAWEWEPLRQQYFLHSFDVRQPDLNWSNPDVRDAIKNVMRFWLDRGIDGFRVDAVQFMGKNPTLQNNPENPDYIAGTHSKYNALKHVNSQGWPQMYAYLSEMAAVLKEPKYNHSEKFMVTEAYPQTHKPVEEYLAFYEGVDPEVAAPFNFEGIGLSWKAKPWREFLKTFHTTLDSFSPLCVASYAFGNHDQHRIVTRMGEQAARGAAVMLLTLPGMAFIYNGEEIGMKNGKIPKRLIQDPGASDGGGRDPERTPMQWNAGKNAGFSTAATSWLPIADGYKTHNVEAELKDTESFLSLYKKLGQLRNKSDALRYGKFEVVDVASEDVLAYTRSHDKETYTILVNFSENPHTFKLDPKIKLGKLVISSNTSSNLRSIKDNKIELHAHEAALFKAS
jgi:alpha-glucosidase